jgi:hypothetical protein
MEKTFTKENKVLLVGDEKAFPLHVRHTYSGVYDRSLLVRLCEESSTPDEVAAKFLNQGITHIMINVYEANRIAGYGGFSMSPKAFGLMCAFWERHLKLSHLEVHQEGEQDKNPIVLLEILKDGLGPTDQPLQNLIAPIYERNELARLEIKERPQLLAFYEDRLKEWPHVLYINARIKELR